MGPESDDRYRRGIAVLRQLSGDPSDQIANKVAELAPDFARMTIEFSMGDVYSRSAVDLKTREVAAIAALAALGRLPQLRARHGGAPRWCRTFRDYRAIDPDRDLRRISVRL